MSQRLADPPELLQYLKIVRWARKRYTRDGALLISVGGQPSTYARIEQIAWRRWSESSACQAMVAAKGAG